MGERRAIRRRAALDSLLHPEFLGIGPFGFLLDREQWMERYRSGDLQPRSFTFTPDVDVRRFGGTAIVVGTQEQEGTHQGRPIDGSFRAALVLVDEPDWRVAAVHLSLRTPPGAPDAAGRARRSAMTAGETEGRSLHDQVALVTGSSRGIGAAIATRFARAGAHVVVHGRDVEALEAVRRQIEADGGRAIAVVADLTDAAQVERMHAEIEERAGPVDVLVANAGGSPVPPGPIEEITEEAWRASIDVNLTATFLTIRSVLPGMKAAGAGASSPCPRPPPAGPTRARRSPTRRPRPASSS